MLISRYLKAAVPTIKKHLIISYLILWGVCSVTVYLLIGRLFLTLMAMLWYVAKSYNFAAFMLACAAAWAILALKKQKKYAVPTVIVLLASLYNIFMILYGMFLRLTLLSDNLFASFATLGAGIAGAIMIYAILTDNKEKEESIRTL